MVFRGKLWGAGNAQPPPAKGMLKLLLPSTPFLFNNGQGKITTFLQKKKTKQNTSSKRFLVNYMHRKSFVWALILSKPSHFLCQ